MAICRVRQEFDSGGNDGARRILAVVASSRAGAGARRLAHHRVRCSDGRSGFILTVGLVMNSHAQALLQAWSAPVAVDASLCLAALLYARGWNRLRIAATPQFPVWRLAAFFAGLVTVWFAIGSPLEALDDVSLTVHMVQHLLLATVAPPLLLLGAPELPLLRGLPQSLARGVVSPFLRSPLTRRFGHLFSNPAICWLVATLALIGWHLPAVFELALRWDWLHKLEHASFGRRPAVLVAGNSALAEHAKMAPGDDSFVSLRRDATVRRAFRFPHIL